MTSGNTHSLSLVASLSSAKANGGVCAGEFHSRPHGEGFEGSKCSSRKKEERIVIGWGKWRSGGASNGSLDAVGRREGAWESRLALFQEVLRKEMGVEAV